jgi:hypothetical protein
MSNRPSTPLRWAFLHGGFTPPFSTARGKKPAEGEQRKLQLGDEPSDRIDATEHEKQDGEKQHVVECTHSHLGGANQQGGDQPAYGGLICHKMRWGGLVWRCSGASHGSTIGSKPGRRYGVFTPYGITVHFCRHTAYIGWNWPDLRKIFYHHKKKRSGTGENSHLDISEGKW